MILPEYRSLDDKWHWVATSTPYHEQGSNDDFRPGHVKDNVYWLDCGRDCFWHAEFSSVQEQWIQVRSIKSWQSWLSILDTSGYRVQYIGQGKP